MLLLDGTYVRVERIGGRKTPNGRSIEDYVRLVFERPDGVVVAVPMFACDLTVLAQGLIPSWQQTAAPQ